MSRPVKPTSPENPPRKILEPPPNISNFGSGLNNYYGNTDGMTLYWRQRLGLGNPYQTWWPYDASDFPPVPNTWMPNLTETWYNFFNECGAPQPKGQGLSGQEQRKCAAQKFHMFWLWVQRAAERNMEKARNLQ